jgi:hypothetical protein
MSAGASRRRSATIAVRFPIARPIDESARHSLSAVKRGHVNDAHGCCMTYIRFIILTAIMRDDFVATT